MTKINMKDKYQTRDGREVRVLCVDGDSRYPVIALIGEGKELHTFTTEGNYFTDGTESYQDLIPALKEYWVNVYNLKACIYNSKEEADIQAAPHRIACVKVKKGEGL